MLSGASPSMTTDSCISVRHLAEYSTPEPGKRWKRPMLSMGAAITAPNAPAVVRSASRRDTGFLAMLLPRSATAGGRRLAHEVGAVGAHTECERAHLAVSGDIELHHELWNGAAGQPSPPEVATVPVLERSLERTAFQDQDAVQQ